MKTIKMEIELTYDEDMIHGEDKEAIKWFEQDILLTDNLFLYSNEIGDTIGGVKGVRIIK